MTAFWYGTGRAWTDVHGSDDFTDRVGTFLLDRSEISNGDKIVRLLVSYYLQTDLHENSDVLGDLPRPWGIASWYRPDPQADPFEGDEVLPSMNGSAMFTDTSRWRPVRWTDGTLHSTQWHCDSGGTLSVKGTRIIEDKTTALLRFGIAEMDDAFGQVDIGVSGWISIKACIERG